MDFNRKKKLLAVLVILFFTALGYRILNPFEQGRVDRLTYSGDPKGETPGRAGAKASPKKKDLGIEIPIELMSLPPEHRGAVLNEHFFQAIPAVKPEAPPPPPPEAGGEERAPAAEDPVAMVERDLSQLQVIGIYTQGDAPVIFFQRGKQTLVVRKGDRIDGKYLVEDITLDAITLRAEHINDTVHIDLTQFLKSYERDRLQSK